MARYTGPVCRLCRREGAKLFFKGDRCYSEKCAIERRPYPPGQHGQGRHRRSDYAAQLREKQKVKRMYGLVEKQFRLTFQKATRKKGVTGEVLLRMLECRLDNAVFRSGFASTRREARQLVTHGHFQLNGHKVDIPAYEVKAGDVITLREGSRKIARILESLESLERREMPRWIEVEKAAFQSTIRQLPTREDVTMPIQEQLIVELYSK
ncbi:MAG: 30S ribosomal protein S4 [Myxococcota bacterium]|nr:30S ribosomal protein S4 [Myxococcota bacterium]